MKYPDRDRTLSACCVLLATCCVVLVVLVFGCRSIPCTSLQALDTSFDVFWEDHVLMLERDDTLTDDDRAAIKDHAASHRKLIDELQKLCGTE